MDDQNYQPTRCSLIQMTPRGNNAGGFDTERSTNTGAVQLTGIKPKALEFASPKRKSPFSMATHSTKDETTGKPTFGLSNCVFKCEVSDSPEAYKFQQEEISDKLKI